MNAFETPAFSRGFVVVCGFVFFGLNVWGVSVARHVGLNHIGVSIPSWWYLVAAAPPLLAALVALALPTHHTCWRRGWVSNLFICLSVVSILHAPTIYALYDFEHPRKPASDFAPSR